MFNADIRSAYGALYQKVLSKLAEDVSEEDEDLLAEGPAPVSEDPDEEEESCASI